MEYLFQVRDVTKVTSLNEGAAVVISTWLITVTTIIFVLSRLGIKMVTMRKIQVDDYLIVGALILSIAESAAVSEEARYGLGDYVTIMSDFDKTRLQKETSILYIPILCLAKLSSLAFIQSLTPYDNHINMIRYVALTVILLGFTSLFSIAFQCGLPHPWQVTSLHCFNQKAFWTWVGTWDAMTDLAIFVLPILLVSHLNSSVYQKVIVLACFSGRILSTTATISRIVYLNKHPSDDVANLWIATVCTQIQLGISISSTGVPYMRPFFESLESGVWRSDELRRRGLTVEDLYGEGFLKSWQIGIARNTAYLELDVNNKFAATATNASAVDTSNQDTLMTQISSNSQY